MRANKEIVKRDAQTRLPGYPGSLSYQRRKAQLTRNHARHSDHRTSVRGESNEHYFSERLAGICVMKIATACCWLWSVPQH
jgi:hypothetical protein